MTAKTRHGKGAHHAAHGADPGTPHERLNRLHAMPGRPEGAMHDSAPAAPMQMPPQMGAPAAPPMGGAPPSAGGMSTDDEAGEQS